jgi:hypothetical protein
LELWWLKSVHRTLRPVWRLSCLLALACLVAAGCGGGGDTTSTDPTTTSADVDGDGGGPPPALGPAKAKESVKDAEKRIADALESRDCDEINELNLLALTGLDAEQRCTYLKRLTGLKATGAEEYGDAGAVIDYALGRRTVSAVLLRDSDGLLHIAFLNPFNEEKTVGTPYAKEFDKAAEQAVKALEKGDCDAYVEVVFRRFGRGSLSDKEICEFVKSNPIANLLEAAPDAQLEKSGGNGAYAFYTLGTPRVNMTLVLASEQEDEAPKSAPPLPKGAAEYAYFGAYRTNESATE